MRYHRSSPLGFLAPGLVAGLLLAVPLAATTPATGYAQPLTERTTNMEGSWVTSPWNLHFQFAHRFQVVGQDADVSDIFRDGSLVNYPTFDVALGLPGSLMAGFDYSSNSLVGSGPNEWQPYLKLRPVSDAGPTRASVGITAAWNGNAGSVDGAVAAEVRPGPLVLMAELRGFSEPYDDAESALAAAAGVGLRLNRYVTVAGDVADLVAGPQGDAAWSASVNVGIPYTPHTFSLQATNVTSGTLEGASVGTDAVYWGFEFTVPFSGFARWGEILSPSEARERGGAPTRPGPAAPAEAGEAAGAGGEVGAEGAVGRPGRIEGAPVVEVEMADFAFERDTLRIPAGTTVRWVNADPAAHSVAGEGDRWWSSPRLGPSESYQFTFTTPGTYPYYCPLHPFMTAVVVVEDEEDGG